MKSSAKSLKWWSLPVNKSAKWWWLKVLKVATSWIIFAKSVVIGCRVFTLPSPCQLSNCWCTCNSHATLNLMNSSLRQKSAAAHELSRRASAWRLTHHAPTANRAQALRWYVKTPVIHLDQHAPNNRPRCEFAREYRSVGGQAPHSPHAVRIVESRGLVYPQLGSQQR